MNKELLCLRDFYSIEFGRKWMERVCRGLTNMTEGEFVFSVQDLEPEEFKDDSFSDGNVWICVERKD